MSEYLVGFDIGGTSARVALFERHDGELSPRTTIKRSLRGESSPEQVAALMGELFEEVYTFQGLDPEEIGAVGAGIAAQMSPDHRVALNAPNLGWRNVPIAEITSAVLGREVDFYNDLNALLWGEHVAGAARGVRDVLAVYVGTGVGGALLLDGALREGAGGKSGELGHIKVEPQGRLCGCGERGCLEAYVGGIHLEHEVERLAHESAWQDQILTHAEHGVRVDLPAADALSPRVEALDALFDQAASRLALAIANACTLINPAMLLLGGGVWTHCPLFRQRTLTRIAPLVLEASRGDLTLAEPSLGEEAGMLGAAALAHAKRMGG